MKTTFSRFVPGIAAVAIAASACLAVATVVQAQTPPPPRAGMAPMPPMPPHGPMGEHGRGGPGMHMMKEVERLKTSLQLNATQAAAWDRAVAQMKPQPNMREQMKARHDRMTAMLDDPNFDPRKMAAEMDSVAAERKAKMTSIRDAWFAVYDTLNPVQRGQVREFLRERMSHMGHERGMQGHERGMHGEMGWPHHDGEPGKAPPAPAPR